MAVSSSSQPVENVAVAALKGFPVGVSAWPCPAHHVERT